MSSIVNCECFKGFHCIAQNCYNEEALKCYINQYETYYLNKLLGCELASQLCDYIDGRENDPDNTPINEELELIIKPFCKSEDTSCCGSCCNKCEIQSQGIKHVLTGLIYYRYMSVEPYINTTAGAGRMQFSNMDMISNINIRRVGDMRWNDAVCSWEAIQKCIINEQSNCPSDEQKYENYNGCNLDPIFLDLI